MSDRRVHAIVCGSILAVLLLTGCNFPGRRIPTEVDIPVETDTPAPDTGGERVSVKADRDEVTTITSDGQSSPLPSPEQTQLEVGESVGVAEAGRAILQFADLLTVELLRDGELQVQTLDIAEQSAFITVLQNGGTLVNDFNPQQEIDRRFTVQTEFATITATGTRFLVVREQGSPLEWIVGFDAAEGDLQVTANGITKDVVSNQARWMAPIGEPSAGIGAEMNNVQAWVNSLQAGATVAELGETLWLQADISLDTRSLTELPPPGEPFPLGDIALTLIDGGIYSLEDCNGDLIQDIAVQAGAIDFNFTVVPNRIRALDVTVLNRAGGGVLLALDPGRQEISRSPVPEIFASPEIVSLRSDFPYHYARLSLDRGCFLGLSLTPPGSDGSAGEPRTPISGGDAVVIDRPLDGESTVENGFTLAGRTSLSPREAEGTLSLRVETAEGEMIQEQNLSISGWDTETGIGNFSSLIFVDADLPADIRISVRHISREDGSVLVEDAISLSPLLPYRRTDQRPPPNGRINAPQVGPGSSSEVDIRIDGEQADWNSLLEQDFSASTAISTRVFNPSCDTLYPEAPEGLSIDLAGSVAMAYDARFLYISFTVFDDGYVGFSGNNEQYFLGDAPQLILDLDLAGDFSDETLSPDDIQLDFLPGRRTPGDAALVALWRLDTLASQTLEEAQIASTSSGIGYFLEAAIPWKSLGVAPEPESAFGAAASISDNDTPGTDVQECMISTAPNRDWQNPTTWGTLVLKP